MTRIALAALAIISLMSGFSHARHSEWDKSREPPVSLESALEMAKAELEREAVDYFCVGAKLANTFSGGDWELHFSSEDGREIWISIGSDKKVRRSDKEFQH